MKNTTATPIEITVPMSTVLDHGMTLVHELGGKPRNYLHEVSIKADDSTAIEYVTDAGYSKLSGWLNNGSQYWLWTKAYPLTVSQW